MDSQVIQKELQLPVYPNRGITIERGEGIYLFDSIGKKYYDCLSGMGINILGHSDQRVISALTKQINSLISLHGSFNNSTRSQAMLKLKEVLPTNLQRFYFGSSGAEAVEAALKFSAIITDRTRFLAATNGYHGKTLGALGATTSSNNKYREPFLKLVPQFDFVEFGSVEDFIAKATEEHSAFIVEVVQGEGGVRPAPADYFTKIKKICEQKGILLIIDEIQTGLGRTGTLFAFEQYNVVPDILCLAKGLAGGVPASATIVHNDLAQLIPRGTTTSTFGGNPLTAAGIIATLEIIKEDDLLSSAKENGAYFLQQLRGLTSPLIKEVRGLGLMLCLELNQPALPYVQQLQQAGVLTIPTGETMIRLLPPLIISKQEIEEIMEIIRRMIV